MALPLAACAGGIDLRKAEVDDMLTTSAVSTNSAAVRDTTQVSDETTVRNAVSSADLDVVARQGLPWANADTGSRGTITDLVEYRRKGLLCRKFNVSRESYNGVALFAGEACQAGDGAWRMLAFDQS